MSKVREFQTRKNMRMCPDCGIRARCPATLVFEHRDDDGGRLIVEGSSCLACNTWIEEGKSKEKSKENSKKP